MPTVAFKIYCPRDCVSRHNRGTAGAPLKPLRDNSALRALSTLRGLRGAPEVPPLCRETQSLGQQMLELGCENATVGKNGLNHPLLYCLTEVSGRSHDTERCQLLAGLNSSSWQIGKESTAALTTNSSDTAPRLYTQETLNYSYVSIVTDITHMCNYREHYRL